MLYYAVSYFINATRGYINTCMTRVMVLHRFGMGQRLRLGLWKPGDALPASLTEMLDYMKSKAVKPVACVSTCSPPLCCCSPCKYTRGGVVLLVTIQGEGWFSF